MGRGRGRGRGNKRSMRKDFGGDAARDNVWMQDKSKQGPPGAVDRSQLYSVPFAEYYKAQGVVPEGEWDAFIDVLRQPLPTTFRINGSGRYADGLRQKLESDFFANFAQGPIYVSRPGGGGLERG
ncbi:tRNA-(m5C) methyltransferase [Monoraphidium neglectum]|uniref:tRNA-(M5C) methyltransferase n=1 Tax=Monoraphidium neglectum TaxID=145388 RepID=A0A0D2J5N1_9CHLO|nr:tRNA-(m5C) methyltransferase [Monoraphidium neglectum]KIY95157.1 tRNA-(m5C) methyltransferase [Monoraphidium neglectum]|eukprot:XP_013894177.1 tRNA-(m5C) methyltransferase [Monoraphidium neglectum]